MSLECLVTCLHRFENCDGWAWWCTPLILASIHSGSRIRQNSKWKDSLIYRGNSMTAKTTTEKTM